MISLKDAGSYKFWLLVVGCWLLVVGCWLLVFPIEIRGWRIGQDEVGSLYIFSVESLGLLYGLKFYLHVFFNNKIRINQPLLIKIIFCGKLQLDKTKKYPVQGIFLRDRLYTFMSG